MDENTQYAVRCYESAVLARHELDNAQQTLRRALDRDIDHIDYVRGCNEIALKLDAEPVHYW